MARLPPVSHFGTPETRLAPTDTSLRRYRGDIGRGVSTKSLISGLCELRVNVALARGNLFAIVSLLWFLASTQGLSCTEHPTFDARRSYKATTSVYPTYFTEY
uniref:Uncharacterized protein n=1 Tax=Vespula pensylvanica TaxID=30213 RepID=A0A834KHL7_VESPE|nr:hypothetical protein H0235_014358 [Vespula pensylvanica]